MSVFIDPRDGSDQLLTISPLSLVAVPARLDAGDAMFVGNGPNDSSPVVGIEVKSVQDLIQSIETGRLKAPTDGQVSRMLAAGYDQMWLLYYGSYRPGDDGQLQVRSGKSWRTYRMGKRVVPYGYLEAALFDLVGIGFNVRHVFDAREAAFWITCLYKWWSKPWDQHKGFKVFNESRDTSLIPGFTDHEMAVASVAARLPGIGFDRAVAAMLHFGSVEAMIAATAQQWAEVPGIGKVIAKSVSEFVRRQC